MAAAAMLAVPQAVRRMIDHGFVGEDIAFVNQYFAMLIVVVLVLSLASAFRYYLVTWLGERVVADLRADVFERVIGLSAAFFDRTLSGEVVSRLTADTTQIKAAVGSKHLHCTAQSRPRRRRGCPDGVTSPQLSVLTVVALPLIVVPLIAFGRAVRRRQRSAQDTLAHASAYAAECIGAVRTLQAFTNEFPATGRFRAAIDEAFRPRVRDRRAFRIDRRGAVSGLRQHRRVLWYGAREVLADNMTPGTLGQFLLYAVFAGSALGQLSEIWGEVQLAAGAAERLEELLAEQPTVPVPARPIALPDPPRGEVEFRPMFPSPIRAGPMTVRCGKCPFR
jgi:ATP-binding cassette, subfamily B, bacterial